MSAAITGVLNIVSLDESYRHCARIARERAKNFYYAFLLLDAERRASMCAIYAFMRECDDLSDDVSIQDKNRLRELISHWRIDTEHALHGEFADNPIWPAFHDTVRRYNIPHRFFHEMIDGITSDLEPREMETFDELYRYCYQVASVVGLTIVHIFGFESGRALLLAEKCGVAFQLTNILRDVREDANLGRIYLPLEDLRRFGVPVEQLRAGVEDQSFVSLMRFEAARARKYYEESAPLAALISRKSRRSLWALREIYTRLLDKLEAANFAVLSRRINLQARSKLVILLRAFLQ
ncbi:MAG TPA: phytoene/squalene synthase family protein [Bryobacteraceae bacterium]|jgi:phytoene synthase|nr:phytoene/squalene synthase family protein [Bryobacteraceae bacterium]